MDGPEAPSNTTATAVVSDMHCVGLHSSVEGHTLCQITNFELLKQYIESCQFCTNEEVEVTT
jgi:hypothetical protein